MAYENKLNRYEAAKLAHDLKEKGWRIKEICKELTREGYFSFKTGKALGVPAVSGMIKDYLLGRINVNGSQRSISKKRMPKEKEANLAKAILATPKPAPELSPFEKNFTSPSYPPKATNTTKIESKWDWCKAIDATSFLNKEQKTAIIQIVIG